MFSLSKVVRVVIVLVAFFATCFSNVVSATEVTFGLEVEDVVTITPFSTSVDLPNITTPGAPASANVVVQYWASCDTIISFDGATNFTCSTTDIFGNPVDYVLDTKYDVAVSATQVTTPTLANATPAEINAFSTLVGNGDVEMTLTVETTTIPTDKADINYSAEIDILVAAN